MRLRVLHSAVFSQATTSMINQMADEQEAAQQLDMPWRVGLMSMTDGQLVDPRHLPWPASSPGTQSESNTIRLAKRRIDLRREYFRQLREAQSDFDLLLIRYTPNDPLLWHFLEKVQVRVILVHHTFEIGELLMNGVAGRLRAALEWSLARSPSRRPAAVIGVTPEIRAYEHARLRMGHRPSFVYPNGILNSVAPVSEARSSVPSLLFVASKFAPWHGLQDLWQAVCASNERFVVHVVGAVPERLASTFTSDPRFRLHGTLQPHQIRALASESWLGLSALAKSQHRGMQQTCALKVRDYLSMGLPVYGSPADVFPDHFPFFVRGPSSIPSILSAAYAFREVAREEVAMSARPYVDKSILLTRLYSELESEFGT